ncbi:hypothetical protein AVEN_185823-1 [Araneus ventricosus]|uniref:Uncharacterized protein n=1 Tax=Araneus ventricosus TaxID=182803 RepID=A0A4Y2SWX8_ARAVE|nr:hypothetical protein AVEN_185823-1 [Araneus ventricosus]
MLKIRSGRKCKEPRDFHITEVEISAVDLKATFPELLKGLGLMKRCYSIKHKPGATPFAIASPRRVPIPLLKQTEAELNRMVDKRLLPQSSNQQNGVHR